MYAKFLQYEYPAIALFTACEKLLAPLHFLLYFATVRLYEAVYIMSYILYLLKQCN